MALSSFRPTHQRLEVACLVLIGLFLILRFPVNFSFNTLFLMDFEVYRMAAELVTTGQGHRLYEVAYTSGMYFKYAPWWALVWSPLAFVSTHHGAVVWTLLNCA